MALDNLELGIKKKKKKNQSLNQNKFRDSKIMIKDFAIIKQNRERTQQRMHLL